MPPSATLARSLAHEPDPVIRQRPLSLPPLRPDHEFLSEWLPADAPEVVGWVQHFTRTGIPFRQAFHDGCRIRCLERHRHVFRWTMLYTHRLLTPRNARESSVWCCRH